ncbi:cyclase family protein [Mycobacterium sp.]|uniref:cyclase family protein n=1 Tax=Mycobacterium sp. TaxID=1785 RepID=UPI002BA8CDEA|nr:cyclase family protein [Mycobacterium sp.]HKP43042.1 cyclase family protein [Mycobacterium sp.]
MTTVSRSTVPLPEIGAAVRQLRHHDVSPMYRPELPLFFPMPHVQVENISDRGPDVEVGVIANMWTLPEHSGSHVDAPSHFFSGGKTIHELPIDALFFQPFKKIDLTPDDPQPGEPVSEEQLRAAAERAAVSLEPGDVAVIEFGWDRYLPGGEAGKDETWWGLNEPGLSDDACEYLANAGVSAVACDTSACDFSILNGEMSGGSGHTRWFLPQGILIVEGLTRLSEVPATGMFVALPLKLENGSGSPLRVLLLTE